jgi:crossover junction endodeoxyribonuclease RusA
VRLLPTLHLRMLVRNPKPRISARAPLSWRRLRVRVVTLGRFVGFTVYGTPQQQGSKRPIGRGIGIEANKNLKPWRAEALAAAREVKTIDGPMFAGPVTVTMHAYFPHPKSHYGTGRNADKLKDVSGWYASAPDLDKLQRAVGDVLSQSQLIQDDRLIVAWHAYKRYGTPRVEVTVQELT